MVNKKTLLIITVALAATVLIALIASKSGGAKGAAPGGARKGRGGGVVTVKSIAVTPTLISDYVITNGEVESQNAVEVFPNMAGKVARVYKALGDKVKKGEVLMKIDPSEPGSYYALSPIEAPISGSILSTPLKAGTKVTTGTTVTSVGDTDNLQITAPIPERYVSRLSVGQAADITLVSYPDDIFKAKIVKVSPVVDSSTRTKEIILNFTEKDERVNAGMFAKVKLYIKDYEGVLVVPKDAVVDNGKEDSYLFINSGAVAKKVSVTQGVAIDTFVIIEKGLREGDRVITEGMLSLTDGSEIKDISEGNPLPQQEKSEKGGKDGKGERSAKGKKS